MYITDGYTGTGGAGNVYLGPLTLEVDEGLTLEMDMAGFEIEIVPDNEVMIEDAFEVHIGEGYELALPDDDLEVEICQ